MIGRREEGQGGAALPIDCVVAPRSAEADDKSSAILDFYLESAMTALVEIMGVHGGHRSDLFFQGLADGEGNDVT